MRQSFPPHHHELYLYVISAKTGMTELNPFTNIPPGAFLYFHYGLVFIFLGTAIFAKNMKGSRLKLAYSLPYLAFFGFTHGTQEWLVLYLVFQEASMSPEQIFMVKIIGFGAGILSFLFLMEFGLSLLGRTLDAKYVPWLRRIQIAIIVIWIFSLVRIWFHHEPKLSTLISQVDLMTRYCIAFTGSVVTTIALTIYSRKAKKLSETISKNLFYSGVAFLFYGVFAGLIPSTTLVPFLHAPIELFRMITALFITLFIVRALNIFDIETREMVVEQVKQLAQSEKLASVGQLAAGIAHEINNPLTNASLNVQMVQKIVGKHNPVDEKLTTKIEAISRNIDRASTIARELLQYSRIDEDNYSVVQLHKVIELSLSTLSYRLDKIQVKKNLNGAPLVLGNTGKLQQVFTNIFNNSIEALHHPGEINITMEEGNKMVTITIADNGIGISQEQLDRLFDPFYSTKEVGSGIGLGLYICYGIIKQHKGKIEIKSEVGKGTAVQIDLPKYHDK